MSFFLGGVSSNENFAIENYDILVILDPLFCFVHSCQYIFLEKLFPAVPL